MKPRRVTLFACFALALTLAFAPMAWAAATQSRAADRSPGAPVAHALSTLTGMAISPLLGTSVYGAFQWLKTDVGARAALPWYAQPKFWLPALLLVGACAAKDSFGAAVPPMLKKPLDVLEVVENKFSGLIAAGAVVPFAMDTFSKLLLESAARGGASFAGLAMLPPLGVNWAPALNVLTIPFGVAVFLVVWMASHAINVLVLLSPWGAIDAALKAARTALMGLVVLVGAINPLLGTLLSAAVIVIAYFVAGWAFRLTVFGAVASWDFFTRRRTRFAPSGHGDRVFTGAAFPGVPVRTYGRLVRQGDGLAVEYRPWLVRKPRVLALPQPPTSISVGAGLIYSVVGSPDNGHVLLLPPRYRGHEQEVVSRYGFAPEIRAVGLRKAWSSFRELVVGRPAQPMRPALA